MRLELERIGTLNDKSFGNGSGNGNGKRPIGNNAGRLRRVSLERWVGEGDGNGWWKMSGYLSN